MTGEGNDEPSTKPQNGEGSLLETVKIKNAERLKVF
jgi:hypothetical protein